MNSVELNLKDFEPIENNFSIAGSILFCNSYICESKDKDKEKLFNKSFKLPVFPDNITVEKSKSKSKDNKTKIIDQKTEIDQSIGCGRYISNHCLELKVEAYKKDKTSLSKKDLSKEITRLKNKPDHAWLKQPSSYILTQKLDDLMKALKEKGLITKEDNRNFSFYSPEEMKTIFKKLNFKNVSIEREVDFQNKPQKWLNCWAVGKELQLNKFSSFKF